VTLRVKAVLLYVAIASVSVEAADPREILEYKRARNVEILEEVWARVESDFIDPELNGIDKERTLRGYILAAPKKKTRAEFRALVNRLLGELETSHTTYFTPDQPEYYQLIDIFSDTSLEDAMELHFPDGDLSYPGIGVYTREIEEKTFITGVIEGAPADRAGLMAGDEIVAVEGEPYRGVDSFAGTVESQIAVEVRRAPGDQPLTIRVVPAEIRPRAMFERSVAESAAVHERNGFAIAYVRMWSYAGQRYHELLQEQLRSEPLRDADALVLDIRGGWGGANSDYLNLFNPNVPTMAVRFRDGTGHVYDPQWRKPVVLLVDGGSRSGKEILAHGFKRYGIGTVVGTTTAGAVVGGRPYLLSDGGILYLAVMDVLVDGERLEGVGVAPHVEVTFDVRYAAGHDPQLEKALDVAAGRARASKENP
jgi:carboxyl-terminal processing protease